MADKCENCGKSIGKMETPYLWNEKVVCLDCHNWFSSRADSSIQPASVPPPQGNPPKKEDALGCAESALFGILVVFGVLMILGSLIPPDTSSGRFQGDVAMGATANATEEISQRISQLTCLIAGLLFIITAYLIRIHARLRHRNMKP